MAYVMLMDHHILPHEYDAFPSSVKAFIYAAYLKRQEDIKTAEKDIK